MPYGCIKGMHCQSTPFVRDLLAGYTLPMKNMATQIQTIIRRLRKVYPDAKTALEYETPFQFLVAVILSAQCTDNKVNEVMRPVFRRYKTAADFASIPLPKLEQMVKQTGFYKMKALAVRTTATLVRDKFGGNVPATMDELLTLRGVARKTANVVIGELTGKAVGVTVDTHVRRLSQRLGLTKQNNPVNIEKDLMALVAPKDWLIFPHLLVLHGRAICKAQRPSCDRCLLHDICPSAFKFPHFQKP